ncbi:Gfo/Idh/MocA family oxidoreductase [Acidobacteria bacterium AH-259-G07]|nr:Gfo/Idh/MocA family oxidoreductase [Acidobacteria bacterium AH-259-G07]
MTEEKRKLGRRNFIKAVAAMPAAGALVWKASGMTPVRAGIIGPGGQGRVLMENSPPSHIRLVAVCDIFPQNLEKGLEIARKVHHPRAEAYTDYRKLLERRDIEAVLIAAPLWLHDSMAVDALQAGKHVFCEKTMAHSIEGCRRMIEAAQSARRNLQIGHQRSYSPLYRQAKQLIDGGVIGDVYHVRALWHRNGDWRRRVPDVDFDPSPWGYPDLEHLKNWRLYNKYSQGLMAELGSHQLQVVNWFSGRVPKSVFGSGGIYRYKDSREVEDHVYLIYEYPDSLTVTYSSIQSNALDHYYEEFMGTEGTIILSSEKEAMLFYEGGAKEATELKVESAAGGPVMQASESRARDAAGSNISGASTGFSALRGYQNEIEGFCATIRNGKPNLCDGPNGMAAAVAILKGNESIAKGEKLEIPPQLYYTT